MASSDSRVIQPPAVPIASVAVASAGDHLADAHDHAPVVAVGDMARDQHEQRRRNELGQPDQAEIERIVGDVVHLPADRHRLHLQGDGAGDPRHPIEARTADGAGGTRVARLSMLIETGGLG